MSWGSGQGASPRRQGHGQPDGGGSCREGTQGSQGTDPSLGHQEVGEGKTAQESGAAVRVEEAAGGVEMAGTWAGRLQAG